MLTLKERFYDATWSIWNAWRKDQLPWSGNGFRRGLPTKDLGVYQSERVENLTCLENYLLHSTLIFFAAYCDGVTYHLSSIPLYLLLCCLREQCTILGSIRCGELIVISDE